MKFIYDGVCLQNKRKTNMDSFLLTERNISDQHAMLGVVCDGVGSLSDGAFASVKSVQLLSEWFASLADTERVGLRLRDEVLSINKRITDEAKTHNMETATTLSAMLIIEQKLFIVHAGDSRIYAIDAENVKLLTVDAVTESGQLTTFIGRKHDVELYYTEAIIESDVFLLCTDGFHNRVCIEEMKLKNTDFSNKKSIRKTLSLLTKTAIERGETDNLSIAIILIT